MVKIRLSRTGKRNQPSYRIVVTDSRKPRDGKNIEILGSYNPSEKAEKFKIDKERLKFWISQGAQMTEAVGRLVKS